MEDNKIFSKVFLWMFVGLMVTFATSMYVASNPVILVNMLSSSAYIFMIFLEIGLVIFLSARINKMSYSTAIVSFMAYAIVNGITFASIIIVYQLSAIILVFGLTSILFLIFGLVGYFTNIDLSKFSNILFMVLVGVIIVSLVNIFLNNSMLDIIICCIGIFVFLGLVAYDVQKIKSMSLNITDPNKVAIFGALELYLDFINIFLYLLRIFGKSND